LATTVFTTTLTLLTVALLGAAAYQQYLLRGWAQLPTMREWQAGRPASFVSIIVPARDEQATVGACLSSLLAQSYPRDRYEVIVVDDNSTDHTLSIITTLARQHDNLLVVSGGPLPGGWTGKCYAIYQAAQRANPIADYLLFVDADTAAQPHALTSALDYMQRERLDLLSLHPFQVLGSFWEKVVQPVVYFAAMADRPLQKVNNPTNPTAAANGQFLMVKRSAYDLLGGHQAVRERIIEDYAMGELFKGAGKRIRLLVGFDIISTRMYKSLAEIWAGWSKNFYIAIGNPLLALGVALLLFIISVLPALLLVGGLIGLLALGPTHAVLWLLGAGAVQFATLLLMRLQWNGMLKLSPLWSLSHPLGALVVEAILINSMVRILSGRGVTWKARTYAGQTSD
jgi:chlorobactene glucosyltransferase